MYRTVIDQPGNKCLSNQSDRPVRSQYCVGSGQENKEQLFLQSYLINDSPWSDMATIKKYGKIPILISWNYIYAKCKMLNAKCGETNALKFLYAYQMRWSVGQIWGWVGSRRSKSALLLLLRVTVLLLAHSTEFHDSMLFELEHFICLIQFDPSWWRKIPYLLSNTLN